MRQTTQIIMNALTCARQDQQRQFSVSWDLDRPDHDNYIKVYDRAEQLMKEGWTVLRMQQWETDWINQEMRPGFFLDAPDFVLLRRQVKALLNIENENEKVLAR